MYSKFLSLWNVILNIMMAFKSIALSCIIVFSPKLSFVYRTKDQMYLYEHPIYISKDNKLLKTLVPVVLFTLDLFLPRSPFL